MTATDLDSLGNTLGHDYTNHIDPNVIQFSIAITNDYVNNPSAVLPLKIIGGIPFFQAVLVNDDNLADAVWLPYNTSNLVVSLNQGNGGYSIQVGLCGHSTNSSPIWESTYVFLDTVAPSLAITCPTTLNVSNSPFAVQGFANESLASLTFDVSNALGVLTNQTGVLTGSYYDGDLSTFTTNYFACPGIIPGNGSNLITLHATDLAGNTAKLSMVLNYTYQFALNVIWPSNGVPVSGTSFTLQAQVNDPAANVFATIVDAHGDTSTVQGLVESSGTAWVQNLPLANGTNTVTVRAGNAAGTTNVQTFTVVGNELGLTVDPLNQLNQSSVTVTGTIADPTNDCVLVNGTKAYYLDAEGDWEADNVPVSPVGTAILDIKVYIGDPVLIGEQMEAIAQPAVVQVKSFHIHSTLNGTQIIYGFYPDFNLDNIIIDWVEGVGGQYQATGYSDDIPGAINIQETFGTNESDVSSWTGSWEYANVSGNIVPPTSGTWNRNSDFDVVIAPGGLAPAGQRNLYLVQASAAEYLDPEHQSDPVPLPPEWLQIQGHTLLNSGITNSDGSVLGFTLLSAPAGQPVEATPVATQVYQNQDYTCNVPVTNVILQIIDANTGTNLSAQPNTVIVGQRMNLTCQLNITNAFMTNYVLTNFQWTVPGIAISNYVVAVDSSSAMVVTNFPTTNGSAAFYWVDGASNRVVQCSATINGMLVTGQAVVNVFSPVPSFYLQNQTAVAADTNYSTIGLWLHFGQNIGTNVGIAMTLTNVPMTNGLFYGGYFVTQLIETDAKVNVMTGTNIAGWQRDRNGLDNQAKYGNITALFPSLLAFNPIWTDSPGLPFGGQFRWVSRNDSFKTYLMFQPFGSGTIPVPMYVGTWGWSGSAKTNGASGGTLLSHAVTTPTVSATTSYPVWTTNSVNFIFANPVNWDATNLPAFNEN